ncbi:MAG TPA: hypothetical protein VLC46_15185 [Thermoanaerobaculia bacterium]|jgi:hypothetical protein|nr:hypothetical protein [Thermoanaerobaculia bacterium]
MTLQRELSWASRVMPFSLAIFSADSPMVRPVVVRELSATALHRPAGSKISNGLRDSGRADQLGKLAKTDPANVEILALRTQPDGLEGNFASLASCDLFDHG